MNRICLMEPSTERVPTTTNSKQRYENRYEFDKRDIHNHRTTHSIALAEQ